MQLVVSHIGELTEKFNPCNASRKNGFRFCNAQTGQKSAYFLRAIMALTTWAV